MKKILILTDIGFSESIDIDTIIIIEPPPLATALDSTNETCRGDCDGNATATPVGGTPPYTYAWNTSPSQTDSQATTSPVARRGLLLSTTSLIA